MLKFVFTFTVTLTFFQDSDSDLYSFRKLFHKESLRYVYKLQEVQERKKFEFVEHLLMFMQVGGDKHS